MMAQQVCRRKGDSKIAQLNSNVGELPESVTWQQQRSLTFSLTLTPTLSLFDLSIEIESEWAAHAELF